MRKRFFLIGAISALSLAFVGVGESNWVYANTNGSSTTSIEASLSESTPVAYIGSTYYSDLAAAINAGNSNSSSVTIYVIPGTNPMITKNCTIGSGDKLFIYYLDGTSIHTNSSSSTQEKGTEYAEDTASYLQNTVTIAAGITLTNYGTIETSGDLSVASGGNKCGGATNGNYTKIVLQDNAKIESYGDIYLYGFIDEETIDNGSQVTMYSGADIYMPFILNDFPGGSVSYGLNAGKETYKCFPLTIFEFRNISALLRINYGASVNVWANVRARAILSTNNYHTDAVLVGTDSSCLFSLSNSSSYLTFKYYPKGSDKVVDYHGDLSDGYLIHAYGGASVNTVSIDAGIADLDSSGFFLPFSYRMHVQFSKLDSQTSASFSMPNEYKLMPGSSLVVDQGCTLTAGSIAVMNYYDCSISSPDGNSVVSGTRGTKYPSNEPGAAFVLNGSMTASAFGGLIILGDSGAYSVTGNKYLTTYEGWTYSGSSYSTSIKLWFEHKTELCTVSAADFLSSSYYRLDFVIDQIQNRLEPTYKVSLNGSSYTQTGFYTLYSSSSNVTLTSSSNVASLLVGSSSYTSGTSYSFSDDLIFHIVPSADSSGGDSGGDSGDSCFRGSSLVTMEDGTHKRIEELQPGDSVLSFSHETGEYEYAEVMVIYPEGEKDVDVIKLNFSNGESLEILARHDLFEIDERKYVEINADNVDSYVGKNFLAENDGMKEEVTLLSYELSRESSACYAFYTYGNLNAVVDGMLTMTRETGIYNYFELDEDLTYNEEKRQQDIDTYGIWSHEDLSALMDKYGVFQGLDEETTELVYYYLDGFNAQYMPISIGKGLVSEEELAETFAYLEELMRSGGAI